MDSREMMELAAKAAGIRIFVYGANSYERFQDMDAQKPWNPLHDDGDALRLVMALDMTVNCNRDELTVIVQSWRPKLCKAVRTNNTDDDVRRAIVEVAAMMGKLLK